jgi:hypothetical protein
LKRQSVAPYVLTVNEEKELFLQKHYPDVTAVLYFSERTGVWYVAIRDPKRICVVSITTLTERAI